MSDKLREFWIEHKKFVDEWVYEAYTEESLCPNKDLIPIHVIEYSFYEKLQQKLEVAVTALRESDRHYQKLMGTRQTVVKEALAKLESDENKK